MDIKEKISDIVENAVKMLKEDKNLLKSFQDEPVKTLEKLIGKDLPDEQVEKVIELVKAKLTADDIADKAEDIKGALKGLGKLFGK